MNRINRTASSAIAALGLLAVVTACAPGDSTTSPSTSPSPSESVDASQAPISGDTPAPASQDEAWVGSNEALQDYLEQQYLVYESTGENPERLEPFAAGKAYEDSIEVARQLAEKQITIEGAPVFRSDATASDYGWLELPDGSSIEFGLYFIEGCLDLSEQLAFNADGSPAAVSSQRIGAVEFTVQYYPDLQRWKVNEQTTTDGQEGALQC